jgi:hypothetical protein
MPTHCPTTNEILARRALSKSIDQRFVDWAVAQLESGADTPHLRMLAGCMPPFNYFEMRQLLDSALRELGLRLPHDRAAAVQMFAQERIAAVLTGNAQAPEVLAELHDYCIELDYHRDLLDFYLLHNAWTDLQVQKVQWYWPGADRSNIEWVIAGYFRSWLEAHAADA